MAERVSILHITYEDCMETLRGTYVNIIKANYERINEVLNMSHEHTSVLAKPGQLSEYVAKFSGLETRLVRLRYEVFKTAEKKMCTAARHKRNTIVWYIRCMTHLKRTLIN